MLMKFKSKPTKKLKLTISLNKRLQYLLKNLTYIYIFLIDLLDDIMDLVI